MAATAQYINTPRSAIATLSTANTAFDGSGTIVTVFTAGAAGARIERVVCSATGTTASGLITLFVGTDSAANTTANTHLYDTLMVDAMTPTTTSPPFSTTAEEFSEANKWPLILGPGQTLRAATTVAQGFRVTAVGGDY